MGALIIEGTPTSLCEREKRTRANQAQCVRRNSHGQAGKLHPALQESRHGPEGKDIEFNTSVNQIQNSLQSESLTNKVSDGKELPHWLLS